MERRIKMVNAHNTQIRFVPVKYILGAFVGAVLGFLAWETSLRYSSATFIISIGQIGQIGQVGQNVTITQTLLEDPIAFMERLRSPAFASSVAKRSGIPELATLLPGRQYGGRGSLDARSLRSLNPNLVEVKIFGDLTDAIVEASRAAVSEIIEGHSEILSPFIGALKKRGELLDQQIARVRKSDEIVDRQIFQAPSHDTADFFSDVFLLGVKAQSEKRTLDLELTAFDAQMALLSQHLRETTVVFPPAIHTPGWLTAYLSPVGGGIAGVIFVFLGLRIWREVSARRAAPVLDTV
jgi:hypothetical protein